MTKTIYKSPLFDDQKRISDDIFNALEKKELFNIPTGRGKTFLLLDVALRTIREHNKPVIISVPNNYLVKDMHQKAIEHFGFDKESCEIRIGADNYLDRVKLQKLIDTEESVELFDRKKVELFLKIHQNEERILLDEFFETITLKDIGAEGYVRHHISMGQGSFTNEWKALTITNHYYLLSKGIYDKEFGLEKFAVLIDEVHEIADVAEQILTESFSFFEYKSVLTSMRKELEKQEDYHGRLKAIKAIRTQEVRAHRILQRHINPESVGRYISGDERSKAIMLDGITMLEKKEHQYIADRVSKKVEGYAKFFTQTRSFLSSAKNHNMDGRSLLYGVFFSPSRGYPTVRTSTGNPLGRINVLFWNKIGMFAGVSGSTTCSFSPTEREIRYGYARLGMNMRGDTRQIHFYDRIFPKEHIHIHLIDKAFYDGAEKDSVYREDFDPSYSPYYKKVIDAIRQNHEGKNTIVLCGGYKEAKYLAVIYEREHGDMNIIYANTAEKTFQTLNRFKQEGGILFATKNYGIGISLEGKELEKLFILKLPYLDYTSKKWQEIRQKSEGKFFQDYTREMLIALIQNFGRVARTKEDRGDIYLLDYGYPNLPDTTKRKIIDIAKEYGILSTEKSKEGSRKKAIRTEDLKREMEELF